MSDVKRLLFSNPERDPVPGEIVRVEFDDGVIIPAIVDTFYRDEAGETHLYITELRSN